MVRKMAERLTDAGAWKDAQDLGGDIGGGAHR
jgi:hypothetical protein